MCMLPKRLTLYKWSADACLMGYEGHVLGSREWLAVGRLGVADRAAKTETAVFGLH